MGSNAFGSIFRITTWGESHGVAIGVVIDGCPSGISIHEEDLYQELKRRAPGLNTYTTKRQEKDFPYILSGVYEGKTTGAPISIIIFNQDADSKGYESISHLLRPGHANFTYLSKYGIFPAEGGGRASARETACRVAAGAIAKKFIAYFGIECIAYVQQIGSIIAPDPTNFQSIQESPVYCPDPEISAQMMEEIQRLQKEGDSVGGKVGFVIQGCPKGLGDPMYEKLEAKLASAFLSIPAVKAFENGTGLSCVEMNGSMHNDLYFQQEGQVVTQTNHCGGILAGISTGMAIKGKVSFKPASSIKKDQPTLDLDGKEEIFRLPERSRHDPCVAIRAVPVVEAMAALVIADAILLNRAVRL